MYVQYSLVLFSTQYVFCLFLFVVLPKQMKNVFRACFPLKANNKINTKTNEQETRIDIFPNNHFNLIKMHHT